MGRRIQIRIKYFLDRLVGLLLFVFFLPLFAVIAIAIRLEDGGPVFFRQERPGLDGKIFVIWKFRTMVQDADSRLNSDGTVGAVDRITRAGKVLRYMSFDELPQIINIIKGEMSFIGPRPVLFDHMQRYSREQKKRFLMKPGISGLAQVMGRNTLKWSRRLQYDVEYVENYSLWLDLRVLLKTVKVVILREGIVLDRNPEFADDLPKKVEGQDDEES